MTATVSVVIPCHNAAGTIVSAVQSALNQTLSPTQVIVADDGSTDASVPLLRALHDPRVVVRPGPHRGVSTARNRGMRATDSEWIVFLDADDTLEPRAIDTLLALVTEHSHQWGAAGRYDRYPDQIIIHGSGPRGIRRAIPAMAEKQFCVGSTIIHRSLLTHVEFDPQIRRGEDLDMWVQLACCHGTVAYDPSPVVTYWHRAGSACSTPQSVAEACYLRDKHRRLARAFPPAEARIIRTFRRRALRRALVNAILRQH